MSPASPDCAICNGAGIIHDFEIAFAGRTSEDVALQLKDGKFGMAKETGQILNKCINLGSRKNLGLGKAVGKMIASSRFPHKDLSLFAAAHELGIPATVHVAIGTDIIHFHPEASGSAFGKTSLNDFFLFCSLVEKLEGGGVFVNVGSAVVLPEVFLKAISYVRNRGRPLNHLEAAVAKLFVGDWSLGPANDAVVIHGGYGYCHEYDVERYFRDSRLAPIGGGTSEIQKRIISKLI